MAFSGSGSSATRAHTHDSTIVNDGGSLNFDNITQGGAAMTAGAITYSDGAAGHMQVLTVGGAGDTLAVNAGATAPEWVASADPHSAGMVVSWAGTNAAIPAGWILADGASVATATYPDLFTAIGYTYGGAGANFTLPNLVSRFIRGSATQTATTGGSDSTTLVEANLAAHSHTVNDAGHNHYGPRRNGSGGSVGMNDSSGSPALTAPPALQTSTDTTGITINNTGSGSAFDNRPAFLELQYIIKT